MTKQQQLFLNGVLRSSISMPVLTLSLLDRARETGVFPERSPGIKLPDASPATA